jgi:hypothetical protein
MKSLKCIRKVRLAVSNRIANSSYSWAPEIFWDDIQNKWMIYWSVSVSGTNTRIFYSTITGSDFKTFSTPQVLLNTGYDIIDGDIIKVGPGNYQMFFKDERNGYKYIRRASGATTPQGTYGTISGVVANATTEGPTAIKQGNEYHVFVDHYSNQGVGVIRSTNIETTTSPWPENWTTFGSSASRLVVSHCNVIEVPKMLVKWMVHDDSTWVKYVRNEVAINNLNYVPVKTHESKEKEIKTFDLLGKMVKLDRIVIINKEIKQMQTGNGRLSAGVYVSKGGKGKGGEKKIEKR